MAIIDLNNLVRPKQTKSPSTILSQKVDDAVPVYVDLHLDLEINKNVGLGNNPTNSNDIVVDTDVEAIKNSIKNIFTTRKGQKILTPAFGSSLEQYLFEAVNKTYAGAIGQEILTAIQTYEPRIEVLKVKVDVDYDQNQYYIQVIYRFFEIKKENVLVLVAKQGGEFLV